jgi:2-dehydro-3-deoxyphosphogluconate aldolase/(4S)-4-hydroxy-2-oxoglutarate aldolase
MTEVWSRLAALRVLPVAVIDRAEQAVPLGMALARAGLPCVEVTLRTSAAVAALRELSRDPTLMLGAGTIVHADQVDEAVDAGASFIVSPGYSAAVVRRCAQIGVPVLPGVATATEIQVALDAGLDVLKFFPAEAMGGVRALAALAAPYASVRFVPTGGVTDANVRDYLAEPSVLCVGGSWMVPRKAVDTGRFDDITRLTAAAVALAHDVAAR